MRAHRVQVRPSPEPGSCFNNEQSFNKGKAVQLSVAEAGDGFGSWGGRLISMRRMGRLRMAGMRNTSRGSRVAQRSRR